MTKTFAHYIGPFVLELPEGHLLPQYQMRWPRYDKALGELAKIIQDKYLGYCAIDIGANVGDTCAALNNYVRVPTLCIEGSTSFHECLYRNAKRIGKHVAVAPVFVGDPNTTGEHSVVENNGTASVKRNSAGKESVTSFLTLEEILTQHPAFDPFKLLKVDTGGMDFTILSQSLASISRNRPILFSSMAMGLNRMPKRRRVKL